MRSPDCRPGAGSEGGAPPEIRALVDAFIKALNSDAAAWEAMAQERFSADLLKKRPAADRKKLLRESCAPTSAPSRSIARSARGPTRRSSLHVKGSTGASGVPSLEPRRIEAASRISNLSVAMGECEEASARAAPAAPARPRQDGARRARPALDAYLSRLAADDVLSGVALVAKNGVPGVPEGLRLRRSRQQDPEHPGHAVQCRIHQQDVHADGHRPARRSGQARPTATRSASCCQTIHRRRAGRHRCSSS